MLRHATFRSLLGASVDLVNFLVSMDYPRERAIVWVRDGARCVYCGRDLLHDRLAFATQQYDHLLPRARWPDGGAPPWANSSVNLVLSCALCNGLKGDFDPGPGLVDADAVEVQRSELIAGARDHISGLRVHADASWLRMRNGLFGLDGWEPADRLGTCPDN